MDVLARFSRVWCPTCNKTQPMIFDVMKANDKNEHDAAEPPAYLKRHPHRRHKRKPRGCPQGVVTR
jgi:hypothetical protein